LSKETIVNITRLAAVSAVFALALPIDGARAQVERSGGGVNAQLAQQYQQAVAERTQLQAENAKLKKQLDDANKQLQASTQQLKSARQGAVAARAVEAQLAAAQAASQSNARSLEQMKSKSEELVGHFRDTVATLRGVESERAQLKQQLLQARAARDQCAERNYQLFQINADVLDRYERQGVFSRIAAAEPFTRIKRNQIENLVLEDRQRVEQLRVERQKGDTASPSTGSPAAEKY
jgi:chromosome segregation ATPase